MHQLNLIVSICLVSFSSSSSWSGSIALHQSWWTGSMLQLTRPYLTACSHAVANDDAFAVYKQNRAIQTIADPVSPICARKCIQIIESMKDDPALQHLNWSIAMQSLEAMNTVGKPYRHRLAATFLSGSNGMHHPNNIRSLYYSLDIRRLFGKTMDNWHVCEIGAGPICGVSKFLLDHVGGGIQRYHIFELPEVAALCQKAQEAASIRNTVKVDQRLHFITSIEELNTTFVKCDLVISMFSISEMVLDMQQWYATNVIAPSPRLYIATNAPPGGDRFGEAEGMRLLLTQSNHVLFGVLQNQFLRSQRFPKDPLVLNQYLIPKTEHFLNCDA
jgi:hypothetical protein